MALLTYQAQAALQLLPVFFTTVKICSPLFLKTLMYTHQLQKFAGQVSTYKVITYKTDSILFLGHLA